MCMMCQMQPANRELMRGLPRSPRRTESESLIAKSRARTAIFRMKCIRGKPGMSTAERKVQFSSDHGPRAGYLYWPYCKTVVRRAWTNKGEHAKEVLMQEPRK